MDRAELKTKLIPFLKKCEEEGRKLSKSCLEEAYPGDSSTSYIINVQADWIDDIDSTVALDFLFKVLFQTVDLDTRKKIFSIFLKDSKEELHCEADENVRKQLTTVHSL